MRFSITYAYKMGLGESEPPQVVCVRSLAEARYRVCQVIEEYKKELNEQAQGLLESSPVSILPEVIKGHLVIIFGTYVEGDDNPVIVETKRRVEDVLSSLAPPKGVSGSS